MQNFNNINNVSDIMCHSFIHISERLVVIFILHHRERQRANISGSFILKGSKAINDKLLLVLRNCKNTMSQKWMNFGIFTSFTCK